MANIISSDEFELKFSELSRAERVPSRAERVPSRTEPSQAGAFQFSSWNRADNMYFNKQQILVPNQIYN